jgi:methionyl-tRNA formyltransferase
MKRLAFCIQNHIVEEVFLSKGVLDNSSIIIRNNSDLSLDFLEEHKPDFIMFPHWSFKVDEKIIDKYKCICFHSSPLPYGRGGSPIQNMILKGHNETEVCSLLMEKEFDSGPIFLRTKISLEGRLEEILIRVYSAIADQIKNFIAKDLKPEKQKGDVTIFKRLKDNRIDLNQSIEEIYNKIRMLDSVLYPNAFIDLDDKKIEFFNVTKNDEIITAQVVIRDEKLNE